MTTNSLLSKGTKRAIEVFLVVIVPIILLGFSAFEVTPLYSRLFNLYGVESALFKRLTTQYGDAERAIMYSYDQETKEDFFDLWSLIQSYTRYQLPKERPTIIGRIAVKNVPSVTMLDSGKDVHLIPDSTPVFVLYCTWPEATGGLCSEEKRIFVGNIGDIKKWYQTEKKIIRSYVDITLSVISMVLGLILIYSEKKTRRSINQDRNTK